MIFQTELIEKLKAGADHKLQAIKTAEKEVGYAELLSTANKITAFLLSKGATDEAIVGVYLKDRCDIICAMVGVMNARCVFVPIDEKLPEARLEKMSENLNLKYLITSKTSASFNGNDDLNQYYLEDILEGTPDEEILYPEYSANDSLYVYFTSGSTGIPKGVVGRNDSLLQFLEWEIAEFEIKKPVRFSQFVSPYFDAFLRDVFVPLLTGGLICIPPDHDSFFTPEEMVQWIDKNAINYIHCVPSVLRVFNTKELKEENFKDLRYVLLSGEKIIPSELLHWYEVFGSRIQLVNLYGTTETTMVRSFYRIKPEDAKQQKISIGSPIADTELLVANKNLEKCNPLVPGDLYIITNYTAKGYLNDEALTKEKFIRIRVGTPDETTAYKTGDKARLMPGGKIDLMGREDRQVKIRGIRVELDEIENALFQADQVKNAVLIKHTDESAPVATSETLVAFVIASDDVQDNADLENSIIDHVRRHLPEYMVPSRVMEVKEFPLLSNGKVDFKALVELLHQDKSAIDAPTNDVESTILAIWKEILGDKAISITDTFHSIGGNSLGIMRLIGRLYKEFGIRISLNELFNNATIQKQAELINKATKDSLYVINKAEQKECYHTSSAQERMHYNYQMNPSSTSYNLPLAWWVGGTVDKEKIEKALNTLVERHEGLRTVFYIENDDLVQSVKEDIKFEVDEINAGDQSADEAIASFIRPFDLSKAPLLRCAIIAVKDGKHILVMDTHHIVCDGMSQVILLSDFLQVYAGQELEPLNIQYKDYAEWEHLFKRDQAYVSCREFWLKQFEGDIPKLELPVTATPDDMSEDGGKAIFEIERSKIMPVLEVLKGEEVTHFSVLFSTLYLYLSQLTGQDDIVLGCASSGRMQHEVERVVGMFAKTLPIRQQMDVNMSFKDFVRDTHKLLVQANSQQVYDLADIVRDVNENRTKAVRSLFDVMFIFQNFERDESAIPNDSFKRYEIEGATSKYPLTLYASEGQDTFNFRFEYSTAYFTQSDIELIIAQFQALVYRIAENTDQSILEYLTEEDESSAMEEEISFNL
ncbi:amino acid adenylation domain-containing protein [Fulvivirga sp. 29W222]|uniref:Amino acid adenylation domain-containing protein n=1 Tax=Fulvivirga marina TaxID=2494733 RepID=A0A937KD90_9BACT|nr:non-ribosomal peptide synthetase [Fulvivirga marina]MBL6448219.1 amino acid adenylation domain-containing protein [Fulvivirga marina]